MAGLKPRQSDWKSGFLFLGNHLVLDFLNTRPIVDGAPVELLPDVSALLRWFQLADLLSPRQAAHLDKQWANSLRTRRTLQALREFREKLRTQTLAWEHSGVIQRSTIGDLNWLMARHPMGMSLTGHGRAWTIAPSFEARDPEDFFAPLAHSAAVLFSTADHRRVRKCASCVLHFQDISKKGTRRWCSMQLCGNRLKVAAYAARKRTLVVR
ncbi:MAG: ABATE domain-containing protein [Terriglobales bacterium]